MAKEVKVVPYDSNWPIEFERIRDELLTELSGLVLSIEHVGSTSVPLLSAKPVIDIDVVIDSEENLQDIVTALSRLGYRHEGNLGIKGREAFKYDSKPHLMKHHLYVCCKDADELRRHIRFRDYLRSNEEAVREYGRIKMEGAKLYPFDMDSYINHKGPFIEDIYQKLGL